MKIAGAMPKMLHLAMLALPAAAAPAWSQATPECAAMTPEQCIASCRQNHPGEAERANRLACYDAADRKDRAPPGDSQSHLLRLWYDGGEHVSFVPYGQNYLLLTETYHPNSTPTSPNPANRVPPSYKLQQGEAKFQFSMKALAFRDATFGHGGTNNIWFAYTQQSYWQMFDSQHSRPFRESNYEPELIVSHPFAPGAGASLLGLRPGFLNAGLLHQSNGQSDPRSRSWNRAYLQFGLYRDFSPQSSLAVLVRPWVRFPEKTGNDNNSDISHFLGPGDLEVLYWTNQWTVSALARVRSIQIDLSRRIWPTAGWGQARSIQAHLQVFTGYGESLIDYNQAHTTIGLGISVPYGI